MSAPSDIRMLVMHGLRLKGIAEAAAMAEVVGVQEADAKPLLDQLVVDGLAAFRDGRLTGFSLTKPGRDEHARLLSAELDASGARGAIESAYRQFLQVNTDLLSICTEWQLRDVDGESTVNDHMDPVYDAAVIEKLSTLHSRVEPICSDLGGALDRLSGYGPRLAAALQRVQTGECDWFTKPMIASYHTVWFEMHEDLLCTLGIERGAEGES
ncbi:MAG: MarR family transcriptional regulator [Acidimicrobiales bacterium]